MKANFFITIMIYLLEFLRYTTYVDCVSQELIVEISKKLSSMHDPIGEKPRGQGVIVMGEGLQQFYEFTNINNFKNTLSARDIIPEVKSYFEGIAFSGDVSFETFILHFEDGQGALEIYYGIAHKQTFGELMKNSPLFIQDPKNPKWSKIAVEWSLAKIRSRVCVEHMDRLWYSCPYKTSFTQQEKPAFVDRMKFKSTQYFLQSYAKLTNPVFDPELN